jgi:hypothetical protein
MRWPFFEGLREENPISIELPVNITTGFAVFFKVSDGGPPAYTFEDLVKSWLTPHSADPFRTLLGDWVDKGLVSSLVVLKSQLPPVDLGELRGAVGGAEQERRLAESTHAVVVLGTGLGLPPHPGLWAAVAAARALIEKHAGVGFDMSTERVLPPRDEVKDLAEMGKVVFPEHVIFDLERAGPVAPALVTRGMVKFGLPDLVLRGVPDDRHRESEVLLGYLASQLAGWAARLRMASSTGKPIQAKLSSTCHLAMDQILAAHVIAPSDPGTKPSGATTLRFEMTAPHHGVPRLRVIPAGGPAHDAQAAVRRMVTELFKPSENHVEGPRDISGKSEDVSHDAPGMNAVKTRFLAGLPEGTRLSVRHGFPIANSAPEYLWVCVDSWSGGRIRGRLEVEPVRSADLRHGDAVELDESEVFDWIITHPDGVREGARLNQLIAWAYERGERPSPPRPDLELLDEGPHIDSKIINNSYSTCSPKIRPSFWRFVRYHPLFRFAVKLALVPAVVGIVLAGIGDTLEKAGGRGLATFGGVLTFLGGLSILAAIAAGAFLRRIWKSMAMYFENGLLTPGIVVSSEPLRVAVMACMSHGGGQPCWGIRKLDLDELPAHPHDLGTRVPFVSIFEPGERPDRWADFKPDPISYGTGRNGRLDVCVAKLGDEEFERLANCIERGLVPDRDDSIALVDEQLNLLETINRKQPGSGQSISN